MIKVCNARTIPSKKVLIIPNTDLINVVTFRRTWTLFDVVNPAPRSCGPLPGRDAQAQDGLQMTWHRW